MITSISKFHGVHQRYFGIAKVAVVFLVAHVLVSLG
jgi:hypothetical protein